jgi:glucose/arabinose dehydrogenase
MLGKMPIFALAGVAMFFSLEARALASPEALVAGIDIELLVDLDGGAVRIARDPTNDDLYYLKQNGEIYRLVDAGGSGATTGERVFSSDDHGVSGASGLAIGPNGTFYVVGNATTDTDYNVATIVKGEPGPAPAPTVWSVLARTERYPLSHSAYDHRFNGIVVSPDGRLVYVNSGSRTDHGEVQSAGGVFPDTREVPLTASIFRLPADGRDIVLPNDRSQLVAAGYLYAEGFRNTFDLAFAPNGDLFGLDNGPDRDMSDELNWLREGHHYGFPWKMGGRNNPQRFASYFPDADPLLNPAYGAVRSGLYYNDPGFPKKPSRTFTKPVANKGPDADTYRDEATGEIKDASDLGKRLKTFTAHRSPLGLVFDVGRRMKRPFKGDGFMLSFQAEAVDADGTGTLFGDPGSDMIHLELRKNANTGRYTTRATRIVGGFVRPVDAAIVGNVVYVLEYAPPGQSQSIWKVSFPAARYTP